MNANTRTAFAAPAAARFEALAQNEEWLGYGYLGERRNILESVASGEYGPQMADQVALTDEAVLQFAARHNWTEDELFAWANSKDGRWFADVMFGGCGSASFGDLLKRAGRYLVKQAAL